MSEIMEFNISIPSTKGNTIKIPSDNTNSMNQNTKNFGSAFSMFLI
jgi:hypothetical protein